MKTPPEIPKKNIFTVPDGYFERLPAIIQGRVAEKRPSAAWSGSWGLALRYAIPLVVLVVAGVFWFRGPRPMPMDVRAELAKFQPEQLREYLDGHDLYDDSDLSTDDLLESVRWSNTDVDDLEKSVYSGYGASGEEIRKVLDEYDSEL